MIGTNLKRFQPERRAMFDDSESEGLNLFFSRPWQVAWIIADAKTIHETFEADIWIADLKISAGAAAVTGFNFQAYKDRAQPADKILAKWEERIYDPSMDIVRQNGIFDGYMHNNLRRMLGKKPDWSWMKRHIDTNALSKAYRLGLKPDLTNFEAWIWKAQSIHQKNLKTRLEVMCGEFKIPFDPREAHKAIYDCRKTRELYEALKFVVEF